MSVIRIKALCKRELTDIFRDKKTLFVMIVLPIILYPLLIVGMALLSNAMVQNQQETVYKIAFVDVPCEQELKKLLDEQADELKYKMELIKDVANPETALNEKELDAYLTYHAASENPYLIHYLGASNDSSTAETAVEDLLKNYAKVLQEEKLSGLGLDVESILHPVRFEEKNHSSNEQTIGNAFGAILPMLIIVSIMMGAVYPAIDVTAGEKERGTLETLLTLPVTNFEMIMSKFLAVSVIACISAILNIVSMGGAFGFLLSFMIGSQASEMGFNIKLSSFLPAIFFTLIVMLVFALFVTAVCMCVCLFAKSFKEANNYVTPLMLIFMFASYVTMVPNAKLDSVTATIPIINVSLLIVDLFKMSYDYALFGIVLLANVVYSLLAILVLAKVYRSERILFSEGMGSLKIFEKRSEMKKGQIPGVGDVILLICVQLLLMFYLGTYAQMKLGFGGIAITQLIILIVPLVYLWYLKADFRKTLSLHRPRLLGVVGALFVWVGVYCMAMLVSLPLAKIWPQSMEKINALSDLFFEQPIWALLLVVALMPAVGEELMFRGFIFGSLKDKTKRIVAILITSAIFGIYHMSLIKFFSTTILGLGFVLVLDLTDSIFCSMLMHFTNNAFSVLGVKCQPQLQKIAPIFLKEELVLSDILVLAVLGIAGLVIGIFLCRGGKKCGVQQQRALQKKDE